MSSTELEKTALDILLSPFSAKIVSVLQKEKKPLTEEQIKTEINNVDSGIIEDSIMELVKERIIEETNSNKYAMTDYGNRVYQRIVDIIKTIPNIDR